MNLKGNTKMSIKIGDIYENKNGYKVVVKFVSDEFVIYTGIVTTYENVMEKTPFVMEKTSFVETFKKATRTPALDGYQTTMVLTKGEAAVLSIVLRTIGGHPDDTLRRYSESLLDRVLDTLDEDELRKLTADSRNFLDDHKHFFTNSDLRVERIFEGGN